MTPPIIEDLESEAGVLACVLSAKSDEAIQFLSQLEEKDFNRLAHVSIFRALVTAEYDSKPLNVISLVHALERAGELDKVGGLDYIQNLPEKTPSPENFEYFLEELKKQGRRREMLWESESLRKNALDPTFQIKIPQLEKVGLDSLLRQRHFNSKVAPSPLRPIYELSGQVICTPANMAALTAAVKAGKTAVIGAMMGSAMTTRHDADMLGFSSRNPETRALLHFDSEQSPDDHWHCNARVLKRAGLVECPNWFHSYCLTGLDYKTAWKCVTEAAKRHADAHGGIHSIILDGIADLVADVNDPSESNSFVAELHGMAIQYDCPIVGVIHFNPGSDKTRGHLGSQFERKAETNLRLDKTDNVTTLWSEKQRRAPISKKEGPCFAWSDAAGMHVWVESQESAASAEKRQSLMMLADEIFNERRAMHYSDIIKILTAKNGLAVSERTASRKLAELSRLKIIEKSAAGLWTKGNL